MTRSTRTSLLLLVLGLSLAVEVGAQERKIGLVLVQRGRDDLNARAVQVASDVFLRSQRFTVVERHSLDQVFQEKGLKGFIGDTEGADIGETDGLDWIGLLSYAVERDSYQLAVRMLEVKSAQVLYAIDSNRDDRGPRTFADRLRNAGARIVDGTVDQALGPESSEESFEAAGERLLENLLATFPAEGYVIQVMGERHVVVDLGVEQGLREGDSLEVFTYGPSILHPVTGREIRGPEIIQAVLTVRSVEAGISTCKIKKAEGPVDVGAVVRFTNSDSSVGNRLMDRLPFNR